MLFSLPLAVSLFSLVVVVVLGERVFVVDDAQDSGMLMSVAIVFAVVGLRLVVVVVLSSHLDNYGDYSYCFHQNNDIIRLITELSPLIFPHVDDAVNRIRVTSLFCFLLSRRVIFIASV